MFGPDAPLWSFLNKFDGPADPMIPATDVQVYETYPVLALIALGWTLPDGQSRDRLPKYNPGRRNTFSLGDWRHVCDRAAHVFQDLYLEEIGSWAEEVKGSDRPGKIAQDCLDACICLLVALNFSQGKACLMVGEQETGYMIVPANNVLRAELETRCRSTGRKPEEWVRHLGMAEL